MRAVVLAGGFGMRLRPYTTILPKPLLPIGDRPILEIILRQLAAAGFTKIDLCVGHLGELIRVYFSEGTVMPEELELDWHWEPEEPLGTAGALRVVPGLDGTFLAMNGDILTTLDYGALVAHHRATGAALTIAVQGKRVEIDLGVLELDGDRVTGYREKPTLSYDVSMGVYVYEARALELPARRAVPVPRAGPAAARSGREGGRLPLRGDLVRPRDDQRVRTRRRGVGAPGRPAGLMRALITGITGQDGSYLAELLLERDYEVHGLLRDAGSAAPNIAHVADRLTLHTGDLTDGDSLARALAAARPDEVYNLAAATSVAASWKDPARTGDATGLGVARLLEALRGTCRRRRDCSRRPRTRSSAAGGVADEHWALAPRTPYGAAKAYAHHLVVGLPRGVRPVLPATASSSATRAPAATCTSSRARSPTVRPRSSWARRTAAAGDARGAARLGLRAGLRRRHAGHAPARATRGLRARHRAGALDPATASRSPSITWDSTGANSWSSTTPSRARPRTTRWWATRARRGGSSAGSR